MLSNEQCIEVAEKVWGWVYVEEERDSSGSIIDPASWVEPKSETMSDPDLLEHNVNSWQGFGRTVEAMAERKDIIFTECPFPNDDFLGFMGDGSTRIEWNPYEPTQLIEATHLAALEAVK